MQLAEDESDEFYVFSGGAGATINSPPSIHVPDQLESLTEWLSQHPSNNHPWQDDDWGNLCRRDLDLAYSALAKLAERGEWPAGRWMDALFVWSDEELIPRSWSHLRNILVTAPENVLKAIAIRLAFWLQKVAKEFTEEQEVFFRLVSKLLETHRNEDGNLGDDPMMRVVNDPVGLATQAVFQWWFRQSLMDDQGLAEPVRSILTDLCDARSTGYRTARVVLGAESIALFRVDATWTREHLLPLFDWDNSTDEALAVWNGLLWQSRLHWPLITELKPHFMAAAKWYDGLGERSKRYAAMVVSCAISETAPFEMSEIAEILRNMPAKGLEAVAHSLYRSLDGSGPQRHHFWQNRVAPFLEQAWPKSKDKHTPSIADKFALICIAAGSSFPMALQQLGDQLSGGPVYNALYQLDDDDANVCRTYPQESLELLFRLDRPRDPYSKTNLSECLDLIINSDPSLRQDHRYLALRAWAG